MGQSEHFNVGTLQRFGWGVLIGVVLWLAQYVAEWSITRSVAFGSLSLGALIETLLIAAGIGALAAPAFSRGRATLFAGALVAGVSYALTHYVPFVFWLGATTLVQARIGVDRAFIGFVEHALLWATADELVFVAIVLLGGAWGGALLTWLYVPARSQSRVR